MNPLRSFMLALLFPAAGFVMLMLLLVRGLFDRPNK
jgi:hypothetical protein